MRSTNKVLLGSLVAAGALVAAAVPASAAPAPPAPVPSVDVQRYVGHWYQVASVPAWYEIQCLRNATADYALSAAGTVSVKNACRSVFGIKSTVTGDAKPLDATNARLNVSFLGFNGSYAHGTGANYIVVGLDGGYRWAAVTDAGRRSGFVLSRTPALAADDAAAARAALRGAGIDPCTLKSTPQDGGAATAAPFC
ncbi:lipocalin family protein [Actinomadura parmotrematis]|uniref:Lipocalin family protein n=1 Tax=Actinomadura parmotrematis TaxID=2864039 RepID=A0ABS7G2D3_9ACTN|nr:lipocalin family protein [Actinomadura parmotrematis]MBW8486875.1 lipocalin family protein [Actinomadura parmotrematis]